MTIAGAFHANAQAVLNEVYAIPGSSRQEFFELYNNSLIATSMDTYTIVTYFEEGSKKGFYVLDLPNELAAPKGYFVGSSAIPFNYQGVTNSTSSQFSWNDLSYMVSHNAYLKKWIRGTSVSAAIDGNANYDLDVLPANFNDFFNKIGGAGATYNVFLYQNGLLQSVFLGGTGGNTFLPTYILSLPSLYIDMAGSAPNFTINFSDYSAINPEYVTQDAGSDNGYIRTRDGYCGLWTKSSNSVTHTPGVTNGNVGIPIPEISVMAAIAQGNAVTGSTVNYDVVAGTATEFPITLHVYLDNGSIPGQLDIGDSLLEEKVETTLSDGPFSTTFLPYKANIIIQTTTSAGCIDDLRAIPNVGVLPVRLISFQGAGSVQGTSLNWQVDQNEGSRLFEIERSTDGVNFNGINVVQATVKTGTERYSFKDNSQQPLTYYRLKITDKVNKIFYSNIITIENKAETNSRITLYQNPVESYLNFSYSASAASMATVTVYNLSGTAVYSQQTHLNQGRNMVTIAADGRFYTGTYIVEVSSRFESSRTKFIKR